MASFSQGQSRSRRVATPSNATTPWPRPSLVGVFAVAVIAGFLSLTALPLGANASVNGSVASRTTSSAAGMTTTMRASSSPSTSPARRSHGTVRTRRPVKHGPSGPTPAVTSTLTISNPPANIPPSPNFLESGTCSGTTGAFSCTNPCVTTSMTWPTVANGTLCTNYILLAINNARLAQGLAPMVLPTNWSALSVAKQLFVVANLERTARGYAPYLGLNAKLNAAAQHAAAVAGDPSIAAGFAIGTNAQGVPGMGGAWSAGFNVLAADYIWMYDDGWAGSRAATSNVVCTSASAAGCWAHRDELLGSDPGYNPGVGLNCTTCEMGTGFAVVHSSGSFVDLVELPAAGRPAMTFTWAHERAMGY